VVCQETEQNQMEHAMTGQANLNADTNKARGSNRDCKGAKAKKGVINKIAKKVNRPADSGILIPAQRLGRRGAQWKRDQQECCLAM
jgi:hypothetical protein